MLTEVLITGGTGFIGRNLIQEILLDSFFTNIYCLTRNPKQINNKNSDAINYINHYDSLDLLKSEPIGTIIHLATMYKRPGEKFSEREMWQSNVENPIQILNAASKKGIYFLNTNSYLQYNSSISSNDNYYLKTKRYFQEYLESNADGAEVKHGSIIVGDTYGTTDLRDKVLNHMINQALAGKTFKVNNPTATIRLSHVKNVSRAICEITRLQMQKTISTVSNFEIKIDSLAQYVFEMIDQNPTESNDLQLDYTKSDWNQNYTNFYADEDPKSDLHKFLLFIAQSSKKQKTENPKAYP